jgi:SAM-dependent methyltransferase
MEWKHYTQANRDAWNEVAPIHKKNRDIDLAFAFQDPSFQTLDERITQKMNRLGLTGKRVAQLSCNNGREVISMTRLGAAYGMGFDISDLAIEEADQLKKAAKAPCDFVCIDAMEIEPTQYPPFDLVYISVGALAWIPDLQQYFRIASELLQQGGHLVVYEIHPFTYMMAVPGEDMYTDPWRISYSYFHRSVMVNEDGLDYYGNSEYDAKPSYEFPYTFSGIFQAILGNGFSLEELEEFPEDVSNGFDHLDGSFEVPLCFTLIARKGL